MSRAACVDHRPASRPQWAAGSLLVAPRAAEKNPNDAYCSVHAKPKVEKVRERFKGKQREA